MIFGVFFSGSGRVLTSRGSTGSGRVLTRGGVTGFDAGSGTVLTRGSSLGAAGASGCASGGASFAGGGVSGVSNSGCGCGCGCGGVLMFGGRSPLDVQAIVGASKVVPTAKRRSGRALDITSTVARAAPPRKRPALRAASPRRADTRPARNEASRGYSTLGAPPLNLAAGLPKRAL